MHQTQPSQSGIQPQDSLNNMKPEIICRRLQRLSNRQLMTQIKEYMIYQEIQEYQSWHA